MRDRTWGRRPRTAAPGCYVTGAASASHGFLAVTNVRPEGDLVAYGFCVATAARQPGRR